MKNNFKLKLFLALVYIASAFVCFGQPCNNNSCYAFGSSDSYQEWNEMYNISSLLPVNPDSCDLTPCYPFQSLDNYQKWKQLKLIELGISSISGGGYAPNPIPKNQISFGDPSNSGNLTSSKDFSISSDGINTIVELNSSDGSGFTGINFDSTGYTGIGVQLGVNEFSISSQSGIGFNVNTSGSILKPLIITSNGVVGLYGSNNPGSQLAFAANTNTRAAFRLNLSGSLVSSPSAGLFEGVTDKIYLTITTGNARKEITLNDISLTSGQIPQVTTNGRLTSNTSLTYASNRLSPTYLTLSAGTAAAGTGPLQFTPTATLLTTPVAGMVECVTDKLHYTLSTGTSRKEIALNDITLTSGQVVTATTNGRLTSGSGLTYVSGTALTTADNIVISAAGKGLQVRTGTNAKAGTAAMVSGTITVANTAVTANSLIFCQAVNSGATSTWGQLSVTKVVGTNFTITSSNTADTRSVYWFIVEGN